MTGNRILDTLPHLTKVLRRTRIWHGREQCRYEMHPMVLKLLQDYQPFNWHQLVLEWPHVSVGDPTRVAYTRDQTKGEDDVQTVTSLGKYLRRHFSAKEMPDHVVRDTAALAASDYQCGLTSDIGEMIEVVQSGPSSCMKDQSWEPEDHPYNAYDPRFGWHMAYRKEQDGWYWGRCLCLTHNGRKLFVRSYKRCPNDGYSYSDEGLESWLKARGYEHVGSWPYGAKLALIRGDDSPLVPYLDGDHKQVSEDGDALVLEYDGRWCLDSTDGTASDDGPEHDYSCSECETGICTDTDSYRWVGTHEDDIVCEDCADRLFTLVTGRHGAAYYVENHRARTTLEGEDYDSEYLSENNIVELHDGEYTHIDHAIRATDDEWYHEDDLDRLVRIEHDVDDSFWAPEEDAWKCAVSGNWYHDSEDYELNADGDRVHPDYYEEEEEEEEEDFDQLEMSASSPASIAQCASHHHTTASTATITQET